MAMLSLVLLMSSSTACARVTVTVDKVQRNGHYIGVPTLIPGEYPRYGYNYSFVSDGTYTVFGSIASDDANNSTPVWLLASKYMKKGHMEMITLVKSGWVTVPANGRSDFSLTWATKNESDNALCYNYPALNTTHTVKVIPIYLDPSIFVDGPDTMTHTVDLGPMSDAVAVYANGKLAYKGAPIYTIGLGL